MCDAFSLLVGDVREVLAGLPDDSADCVVTSPPYWKLRDYGEPGQIGQEPTLGEYVASIVAVFRELRRILAAYGTCWLNLGDGYSSKGLLGIPWRVAFALQEDGWCLRSEIVWSKSNPTPESARDRPTRSHESLFMLAKRPRYYFDQEAVKEPAEWARWGDQTTPKYNGTVTATGWMEARSKEELQAKAVAGRNVRTVWEIATQAYPGAHFATYPEELVKRVVLAGCPRWVCRTCGKPRERIVESSKSFESGSGRSGRMPTGKQDLAAAETNSTPDVRLGPVVYTRTLGWTDCGHDDWRPGVCLDPFIGSGTTAVAALREHRECVGVELNPEYAELCRSRVARWWKSPARPHEALDGQEALF